MNLVSAHTASLKDFFDKVVSGKTDNDQMALASLGVNKKRITNLFNSMEISQPQ